MEKVFISFHHANDQSYKDAIIRMNNSYGIFHDMSVNTMGINDNLPTQRIRQIIRDDYLRDSTVTIVLVGTDTRRRKHVDWEIKSSMIDGSINKKSGILVIMLPSTGCTSYYAAHDKHGEKSFICPDIIGWSAVETKTDAESRYPYLPDRILDNVIAEKSYISIVPWSRIQNSPEKLKFLIDVTGADASHCEYDMSRPMRMANSSPY